MKHTAWCTVISALLTVVYCLLPKSALLVMCFLFVQGLLYNVNVRLSCPDGHHNVQWMGCSLVLLSGLAALVGLLSWFHFFMHFVMCSGSSFMMADLSRKPGEEEPSYYAEKRRRRREGL